MVAARFAVILSFCAAAAAPSAALEKPAWSGGAQAGYNLGQNGEGWPKVDDPLSNMNRGGFYIRSLRVKGVLPFDSTFQAVFTGNILGFDVQEAYVAKRWGPWLLTAGKFRGAGLKSGSGTDEYEMLAIRNPLYAYVWLAHKRLHNFRDFGVQVERAFFDGRLNNKLYVHNANGQNVFNNDPSFPHPDGPTQVLGLDYGLDWKVSPFTTVGGHVGARGDREWAEFLGRSDPWRADLWFKTNPLVDASVYHQMDFPKVHILTEAMMLANRNILVGEDSASEKSWGGSVTLRVDPRPRWSPYLRYEFTDPTDGRVLDDSFHILTLGTIFRPSPQRHPGLKLTGQYVRALEEGGKNLQGNDIAYVQMQMLF